MFFSAIPTLPVMRPPFSNRISKEVPPPLPRRGDSYAPANHNPSWRYCFAPGPVSPFRRPLDFPDRWHPSTSSSFQKKCYPGLNSDPVTFARISRSVPIITPPLNIYLPCFLRWFWCLLKDVKPGRLASSFERPILPFFHRPPFPTEICLVSPFCWLPL